MARCSLWLMQPGNQSDGRNVGQSININAPVQIAARALLTPERWASSLVTVTPVTATLRLASSLQNLQTGMPVPGGSIGALC